MKKALVVIFLVSLLTTQLAFAAELSPLADPTQRIDAPYRLFKTQNIWTQLLLDTRNGRVWQVVFSVQEDAADGKFAINTVRLVPPDQEKIGRYTLYPTSNMWNWMLLDQEDGRVWQVQYNMEDNKRFMEPILDAKPN